MSISLTVDVHLKWHDKRLVFFNLFNNHDEVLPNEEANRIWRPRDDIIIENLVIGEDKFATEIPRTKIIADIPEELNPRHAYESNVYNGSYNLLEDGLTMKLTLNCKFNLYRFPFDNQTCPVETKLLHRTTTNFSFVQNAPVLYKIKNC